LTLFDIIIIIIIKCEDQNSLPIFHRAIYTCNKTSPIFLWATKRGGVIQGDKTSGKGVERKKEGKTDKVGGRKDKNPKEGNLSPKVEDLRPISTPYFGG